MPGSALGRLRQQKEDDTFINRIPEQVIEEIKSRSELVGVVEQYVRLDKRSGSNFFGLCPFHQEDTASFSVSPAKQIYYCFGCHKGGDVIHFMMDIEKCSYIQSVQILAERAGVKLPEPDDEGYRQRSELIKNLQAICLEGARFFYHSLVGDEGKAASLYLQHRAISTATARRFGLGFAPDMWDGLLNHVAGKGWTDHAMLLQSGLFRQGKSGGLYDLFRNRLMFPIFDVMGRVIAFGGRVMDESQPKYINSPETPIYIKGRHLYALNLAKNSHMKQLVIVEGYMDAIAMHQAGIDHAVASLGTALTENQALLLRKYTEDVIIAYDADAAGQAATLRSLEILQQKGLKLTVLQVPDSKDPDEFIRRHGAERFNALLEKALPLLDYKLLVAHRENENGQTFDMIGYQEAACQILAHEENAIVRELYATKLAEELHTSSETVLREIEKRHDNPGETPARPARRPTLVSDQRYPVQGTIEQEATVSREELYLLGLLAADPDIFEQIQPIAEDFSPGAMQEFAVRALARAAERKLDAASLVDLSGDYTFHGKPLHEWLVRVSMKLEETFGRQDLRQAATEQLDRMREKRRKEKMARLTELIGMTEDSAEKEVLKQQLRELSSSRRI